MGELRSAGAGVRTAALSVLAVLMAVAACSSSASPKAHGTAVTPLVSAAPTPPAALSVAGLQRLHWTALPADPATSSLLTPPRSTSPPGVGSPCRARRFKPEPESLTWTCAELIAMSPNGLIALGPR